MYEQKKILFTAFINRMILYIIMFTNVGDVDRWQLI